MKKRSLLILILLVAVIQPFVPFNSPPMAQALDNWWDINWFSRKQINITGSTVGVLTNYPVKLILHNHVGVDVGNIIHLDGTAQADYSDIRFLANDQATPLSHWHVDNYSWTYPDTVFWVKIPSIPVFPNKVTIWIYWRNPTATTLSNIDTTFPFADDFNPVDPADWLNVTGGGGGFGGSTVIVRKCPTAANMWYVEVESSSANGGWSYIETNSRKQLTGGSSTYGWCVATDMSLRTYDVNAGNEWCGMDLANDFGHDIVAANEDNHWNGTSIYWFDNVPWNTRRLKQEEWDNAGNAIQTNWTSPSLFTAYGFGDQTLALPPTFWQLTEIVMFSDYAYISFNGAKYKELDLLWDHLPLYLGPSFSSKGWIGVGDWMRIVVNWVFMRPIADPEPVVASGSSESWVINEASILNMDGCGPWVTVSRKQYLFYINASSTEGGGNITAGFMFRDNAYRMYSFMWNATSRELVQMRSPEDGISATILNYTIAGDFLYIYFSVMFNQPIRDTLNVNLYVRGIITSTGWDSGWVLVGANYFGIYNLGGLADLTFSGWAGRSTGGDVFELYAADQRTPVLIPTEGFDHRTTSRPDRIKTERRAAEEADIEVLTDWRIFNPQRQANITMLITGYLDMLPLGAPGSMGYNTPYNSLPLSLRIIDSNTTANRIMFMEHNFRRTIYTASAVNELVKAQFYMMSPDPGILGNPGLGGGEVRVLEDGLYDGVGGRVAATVRYNCLGNLTAVHGGGQLDLIQVIPYQWYNVTIICNLNTLTFDVYVDNILRGPGLAFTVAGAFTQLDAIWVGRGDAGILGNDFFLDDIKTFTNWTYNYGGQALSRMHYKDWQHWHMLFGYGIEKAQGLEEAAMDEGYIEFGVDTCIDDVWIEPQYKVRIYPIDAVQTKKANWVLFNVSWYHNSSIHAIKTDQIYSIYQGMPSSALPEREMCSMFLDLWVNKVNASSVVGGRVNAEWFGMAWEDAPWWNIAPEVVYAVTGKAPWGPKTTDITQSMFFHNIENSTGSLASIGDIEMVRVWTKVYRSNVGEFHYKVRDIDMFSIKTSPSHTAVEGIDTPSFTDTQVPTMSGGKGPFAGLWAAFINGIVKPLSDVFLYGAMNAWTWFISQMDLIFGYFGYPGFFSTILGLLGNFWTFFTTGVTYLFILLPEIFTFLPHTFAFVILYFGGFVTFFLNLTGIVGRILNGTQTGIGALQDVWALMNFNAWATPSFIGLCLGLMWFFSLDDRYRQGKGGWMEMFVRDIQTFINIITYLADLMIKIIDGFVAILFRIVESVPVIS